MKLFMVSNDFEWGELNYPLKWLNSSMRTVLKSFEIGSTF